MVYSSYGARDAENYCRLRHETDPYWAGMVITRPEQLQGIRGGRIIVLGELPTEMDVRCDTSDIVREYDSTDRWMGVER
jgi:hypothetical protein